MPEAKRADYVNETLKQWGDRESLRAKYAGMSKVDLIAELLRRDGFDEKGVIVGADPAARIN